MARLPRRLGHARRRARRKHVDELRTRLIVMLGAIAVGTASRTSFTATSSTGSTSRCLPGSIASRRVRGGGTVHVTITVCL